MNSLQQVNDVQIVVVGVKGSIGSFLAKQITLSAGQVVGIDIAPLDIPLVGIEFIQADITQPNYTVQKTLQKAQIVVFALSQEVINQALPSVRNYLSANCLLVDTLSIKSSFHDLLIEQKVTQPAIGINPMFSGDLTPTSRPIAVVVYRQGSMIDMFLSLLKSWQLNVIIMDSVEHDREMALLQSLVHAVILSFANVLCSAQIAEISIDALAPPPFRVLLTLVARMTQNNPDVYWEIQASNHYASEVRQQLRMALMKLETNVASLNRDDFCRDILQIKSQLIEPHQSLIEASKQIFECINQLDTKKETQETNQPSSTISEFRKQIDHIDDQIVELLGRRISIVRQVAKQKKTDTIPVMQHERVIEVKQRCSEKGLQYALRPEFVAQLYQSIIDEACRIEHDYIIGGQ
ncbi:chorismate mutase [Xenorhabdus bovienii]|uniref:chorismate mutase n=1 Tax=Xenorhabdus bovienii TaxID=40576 RepID=UPI0023B3352E|nr:chorismate mutase [Xenorhabdus bovienii]MDE9535030.1 prephenate dehydrogenase/arogenate dehydrogenase family protein [Xenorhabdus bovienii]MDE9587716.1 prephenate dehydrogenase/arogenate dehydrogenase family protein [Xenorhabdus bovienii]